MEKSRHGFFYDTLYPDVPTTRPPRSGSSEKSSPPSPYTLLTTEGRALQDDILSPIFSLFQDFSCAHALCEIHFLLHVDTRNKTRQLQLYSKTIAVGG